MTGFIACPTSMWRQVPEPLTYSSLPLPLPLPPPPQHRGVFIWGPDQWWRSESRPMAAIKGQMKFRCEISFSASRGWGCRRHRTLCPLFRFQTGKRASSPLHFTVLSIGNLTSFSLPPFPSLISSHSSGFHFEVTSSEKPLQTFQSWVSHNSTC